MKSLSLSSLDDFVLESDSEDVLKTTSQQKPVTEATDVPVSTCTELDASYDLLCDNEFYKVHFFVELNFSIFGMLK